MFVTMWVRCIVVVMILCGPSLAVSSELTADVPAPTAAAPTAATPSNSTSAPMLCGALPTKQCDPSISRGRVARWPEVWGYMDTTWDFSGTRMAPNGVPFEPLFVSSINLNIGLLPNKVLYLFTESRFWMQEAGLGITNPSQ